jgi:23S rRNA (guanosine2251-2'-O)-methyltransferase
VSEYLYRRNTVLEPLRGSRRVIHRLWYQKNLRHAGPIIDLARRMGVPSESVLKNRLSDMAEDKRHQGVVLEVGPYPYSSVEEILALSRDRGEMPFLLLLDLLHGPRNIGALLRAAEVFGVHGVILQDRRAPDITPQVVIYSAGAAEHLLVAQVTNLVHTIKQLKTSDVWIAGLDLDAEASLLGQVDLNIPIGMVVGHEGSGLRRLVRESCDFLLQIPMRGQVGSLNASTAGAIALFAAWQAREFEGAIDK